MEDEELRRQFGAQGKEDMKIYSADRVWSLWVKLLVDLISK